jgi:hypothetical protein
MWVWYILLGFAAGIASGFFGIGGGTVLIPVMVYLFGLTQHQAQGTTLAIMIPPIGLLAVWEYYRKGNVVLGMAIFICVGFLVGGLLGAVFANKIPDPLLKRIFGVFLLAVSLRMIFGR